MSRDIGIDLGTANTLIYVSGTGIVLHEPSVVAIDKEERMPLAVGKQAEQMLGRTPNNVIAMRPLRDGVIADFESAEIMLKEFIERASQGNSLINPRILIGMPSGITAVEKKALAQAIQARSDRVHFVEEPIAAAIGADLPITEPVGNMLVDIGGGTTEVSVLSYQGTVLSKSIRVAGDELTESIRQYLKKVHNLQIGERTAETIKISIGSAYTTNTTDEPTLEVRGLHLLSGLPTTANVRASEIRESMLEPLAVIVQTIKDTLEETPAELAADIIDRGIMLVGGGALLRGLDTLISHETEIFTHIASEPINCVVLGTGKILENPQQFSRVLSKDMPIE